MSTLVGQTAPVDVSDRELYTSSFIVHIPTVCLGCICIEAHLRPLFRELSDYVLRFLQPMRPRPKPKVVYESLQWRCYGFDGFGRGPQVLRVADCLLPQQSLELGCWLSRPEGCQSPQGAVHCRDESVERRFQAVLSSWQGQQQHCQHAEAAKNAVNILSGGTSARCPLSTMAGGPYDLTHRCGERSLVANVLITGTCPLSLCFTAAVSSRA